MKCMEGVVGGHVGYRVFVKIPVSGVTGAIILEVTQSLESSENIQRLFTVQVTQYSVGLVRALCAHWVFILPF